MINKHHLNFQIRHNIKDLKPQDQEYWTNWSTTLPTYHYRILNQDNNTITLDGGIHIPNAPIATTQLPPGVYPNTICHSQHHPKTYTLLFIIHTDQNTYICQPADLGPIDSKTGAAALHQAYQQLHNIIHGINPTIIP